MQMCERCISDGAARGGHTCRIWNRTRFCSYEKPGQKAIVFQHAAHDPVQDAETGQRAKLDWDDKVSMEEMLQQERARHEKALNTQLHAAYKRRRLQERSQQAMVSGMIIFKCQGLHNFNSEQVCPSFRATRGLIFDPPLSSPL